MPRFTRAAQQTSGGSGLELSARLGFEISATSSGQEEALKLGVQLGYGAGAPAVEAYKYRPFTARMGLESHVEHRDAMDRLKWADDTL